MITIIAPKQFIEEVKQWGVKKESRSKVRMMERGKVIFFRFSIPQSAEVIETRILKDQYNSFDFVNLGPISVGAVWKDETNQKDILEKLTQLQNANTTNT